VRTIVESICLKIFQYYARIYSAPFWRSFSVSVGSPLVWLLGAIVEGVR
jgi:hypothetical protein